MRILLFTGKGGVGKSTVAAGTAALAAAAGHRTLVLSTDAAHSLADAFAVDAGPEPSEVAPGLFVQQVDAQLRFQQSWAEVQHYLLSVLDVVGVDPVAAEELTVLPGAEEVLALLELRHQALSGQWDVVVVDCAPTAETLRLLALPEALGWYMQRVFPAERRIVKALRPVLARGAGVPMPADHVFDAVERLHAELDEVRALLTGPGASVRVVLTPESVVLAEARRSWTNLSLFGYRVDGVVANRVFPDAGGDAWRAGWVASQAAVLEEVAQSFAGLPVWRSEYRGAEPVGVEALRRLADEVYTGSDPLAEPDGDGPFSVGRTAGGAVLRLALPHVSSADVDLARNGDELVLTVGSYRRLLTLPAGTGPAAGRGCAGRVGQPAGALHGRARAAGRRRTTGGGAVSGEQRRGAGGDDEVGSLAEEAAKLLGALGDWAQEQAPTGSGATGRGGPDLGAHLAGLAGLAGHAAEAAAQVQDHLAGSSAGGGAGSGSQATGPECRWCPVCRTAHAVRQVSPEVRAHLGAAASSLAQAAAALMATHPPSGRGRDVETIDLDDEDVRPRGPRPGEDTP